MNWLKPILGLVVVSIMLIPEANAADAIPATHVGTWRRTEVLDTKSGQGAKAARRYFMIMRADGQIIWTGTKGAPNHSPMTVTIRGTELFQKTSSGEKSIGKATIAGNRMTLIFRPTMVQIDSAYVLHSRSINPKDVEGITP